ncbi:MAG TPA: hypothetical protein VFV36_08395, partial [Candidatus Methylomirabilis sp.]|nr:hypothetical protein [Candidatus Methylomirabilis sp.]
HDLHAAAAAVNQEARGPEGRQHVATALAALFDLRADTVEAERATTGLGFGEIAIAHAIAEATRGARTFQQIVAMKESGLGWGQVVHALRNEDLIAEEHLGEVVSQVRRTGAVAGALRGAAAPSGGRGRGAVAVAEARSEKGQDEFREIPGGPPAGVRSGEDRGAGHGRGGGRGGP